jgi:hypothetical protein
MAEQRLHSALAPIDLLTREEMDATLHQGMDAMLRDRFRGLDLVEIVPVFALGNGGTLNLASNSLTDAYCGPEQGDIWMLVRANVVSSAFATDAARYVLFRGSTPSDTVNAFTNRFLLSGQTYVSAITYTTMTTPSVPASGVAVQNTTNQTYQVVITSGTITAVVVNGITVGTGDGTYYVPAYGSISVTYSVAPSWAWTATQTNTAFTLGQQQGISYDPGNKKVYLKPGQQLYAQVFNTTAGNTYVLTGDAIRVPAEMKGKVL